MVFDLNLEKLHSKNPKIKYGYTKELLKTAAENPGLLYQYFDTWCEMVHSENNVFKWTAIDILGEISAVDQENKLYPVIDTLYNFLHGGQLVSCNHAIFALGLIAKNKIEKREEIIREFLALENDDFDSEDCKNIAIGKVLEMFKPFLTDIKTDKNVLAFIDNSLKSKRPATVKKANILLKEIKLVYPGCFQLFYE